MPLEPPAARKIEDDFDIGKVAVSQDVVKEYKIPIERRYSCPKSLWKTVIAHYGLGEACVRCEARKAQHLHHIDLNRNNNKITNLIPLCLICHFNIHKVLPTVSYRYFTIKEQSGKLVASVFRILISKECAFSERLFQEM